MGNNTGRWLYSTEEVFMDLKRRSLFAPGDRGPLLLVVLTVAYGGLWRPMVAVETCRYILK
jgi:hypothetical protein